MMDTQDETEFGETITAEVRLDGFVISTSGASVAYNAEDAAEFLEYFVRAWDRLAETRRRSQEHGEG